MQNEPKIVERNSRPYAAVRRKIGMSDVASVADSMSRELFAWLGMRGIQADGAPFFKYNCFDTSGAMEIEWGAPVSRPIQGDDRVHAGILPPGRYATVTHMGSFAGLRNANGALLEWIAEKGYALDEIKSATGEAFGCRLEIYHTDPRQEPDSTKWQTEITMRLADEA